MRWAGHVGSVGIGEVHTGFWWGNPREYPSIDGRIILRLDLKELGGGHALD
jgi:hypothetical protein